MIYSGYVKVALGKPETGQVKLKFSPGTLEAKFSLGEWNKSNGQGFTGSVTEGCDNVRDELHFACFHSRRPLSR